MSTFVTIKRSLIDYIKTNNLKIGHKLPTENDLAEKLGVGRLTLREVLKVLREEGLIYTVHGIGTFISSSFEKINDTVDINLGITEMISSAGYKPGVKISERKLVKASEEISNALNIPKNSDVFVCQRVRTADEKPIVYSIDYFAPNLVAAFLGKNDENISLYEFIEIDMGLKIGNSLAEIIPINCSSDLAKKLEYEEGGPILLLKQITYDQKGSTLFFTEEYFRPDRFKISLNRRRIKLWKHL